MWQKGIGFGETPGARSLRSERGFGFRVSGLGLRVEDVGPRV